MGLQGNRHPHAGGIEGRPMTILDRKRAGHSKKKRCFRETQMCVLHIIWCKRFCPLVFQRMSSELLLYHHKKKQTTEQAKQNI